jgi:hypothetical protein
MKRACDIKELAFYAELALINADHGYHMSREVTKHHNLHIPVAIGISAGRSNCLSVPST